MFQIRMPFPGRSHQSHLIQYFSNFSDMPPVVDVQSLEAIFIIQRGESRSEIKKIFSRGGELLSLKYINTTSKIRCTEHGDLAISYEKNARFWNSILK